MSVESARFRIDGTWRPRGDVTTVVNAEASLDDVRRWRDGDITDGQLLTRLDGSAEVSAVSSIEPGETFYTNLAGWIKELP